jgi:hypothetical protein
VHGNLLCDQAAVKEEPMQTFYNFFKKRLFPQWDAMYDPSCLSSEMTMVISIHMA